MSWDRARVEQVALAYRQHYECVRGDEAQRAGIDQYVWAVDLVHHQALSGELPLDVVDVVIHDAAATDALLEFLATDVFEDLLTTDAPGVVAEIATRCDKDPRWAQLALATELQPKEWAALPRSLQERVGAM